MTKMGGKAPTLRGSLRPEAACDGALSGGNAADLQTRCNNAGRGGKNTMHGAFREDIYWLRKLETRAALLEDARSVDNPHFHVLHSTQEFCVLVFGCCQENQQQMFKHNATYVNSTNTFPKYKI
jgi:hypothetical protein